MKIASLAILMTVAVIGVVGLQYTQHGGLDLGGGSSEQILAKLDVSEAALNRVYENLDSLAPEDAVQQGMAHLKQVDASYQSLAKHELAADAERVAQMTVLRSYYLGQTMMPQLKSSFQSQADRVIQLRPESEDADIAKVLLFCSKHDLNSDAKRPLLKEIANEAQGYGVNNLGVGLYSIVAHEFWKNGKPESAEKVLETGISHYKNCSEKIKLVNQMIDQGHRDPPKPKMSQAQFKRMQRALANASPGTGTKAAVKFRS